MYELFTLGGGAYLVDLLNAVAAITSGGAYITLAQLAGVGGLAWGLFRTAFGGSWEDNAKGILPFAVVLGAMNLPHADVRRGHDPRPPRASEDPDPLRVALPRAAEGGAEQHPGEPADAGELRKGDVGAARGDRGHSVQEIDAERAAGEGERGREVRRQGARELGLDEAELLDHRERGVEPFEPLVPVPGERDAV
ncbi:MAG: conjugal transfer protein TraG N-terminal domain-containing protein, partial [Chloroflexi bacterium]|nr:conjugal transfer protein TraG N-terminal domain-containing protein [Chloroflexota bacterium]